MDEEKQKNGNIMKETADTLFEYLRSVIFDPSGAALDIDKLPDEFKDLGKGLIFFSECVTDTRTLAKELSAGNLNRKLPPADNEIAAPLKSLQASLKHLTWQAKQVASGDYKQRVDFMGEFSDAFNNMIMQLENRWKANLGEKKRLQRYVDLMLANFPDPVLLFDSDRRLAYVSRSYGKYFFDDDNISGDAVSGKTVGEALSQVTTVAGEAFAAAVDGMLGEVTESRATAETDRELDLGGTGETKHYHIHVTPMLGEAGDVQGYMVVLYDTTEIVLARREAEAARELAEKSSRAKSDFLARMSHEMRTPMNAIIGMTDIYKTTGDPQRKDYCIGKISEASNHLLGVINDVLDMAKIESDKFELSPAAFDFRKMVSRILGIVQFKADERKLSLKTDIGSEIPETLFLDEQRLAQVITNLLSNAVKFTPQGGNIAVRARMRGGMLSVTVKDTGIGLSDSEIKKLFKPFEQADGGISRKYGGTGLGLAICKRIVDMMGGSIRVESRPDQGASFTFEVPAGANTAEKPEINAPDKGAAADHTENIDGIFAGRRALVAEDVGINLEILAVLLEKTGIAIEPAEDGKEAVRKYLASPDGFDIILMDINMPNMDGYTATEKIRASGHPRSQTVPIIAMTANVFKEDIDRSLKSGMNDHLGKPIDTGELISTMKKWLKI